MGSQVMFDAWAELGAPMKYEYATYRRDPGGYTLLGWKTLGTCTASLCDTDVEGITWCGCRVTSALPKTDCAFSGTGVWYGHHATPSDGHRFARVRVTVNGAALWTFPATLSDEALFNEYLAVGGRNVIINHALATPEVELHTLTPQVGVANLADALAATDVFVAGDHAFVGRQSGGADELVIVDIANPGAPLVVGSHAVTGSVQKLVVENDLAYVASSANGVELQIFDVRDRTNPQLVKEVNLPGFGDALSISVVAGNVYIGRQEQASQKELAVVSHPILAPAAAQLVGEYEAGADVNGIDVTRGVAFLATSHAAKKFIALDVTNPLAIVQLASVAPAGAGAGIDVDYHAGKLYGVTGNTSGANLFVFSAPLGGGLTQLGSVATGATNTGLSVYADRALVSTLTVSKALTVVDVANPAAPAIAATIPALAAANAVAVRNGVALLATGNSASELALLSPGVPLEPVISDVNGGGVTVSCLGDSNGSAWCSNVAACLQSGSPPPAWCADPGTAWVPRPTWQLDFNSYGFSLAGHAPETCWMDGYKEMSAALCQEPFPICNPACCNPPSLCGPPHWDQHCNVPCNPADATVIALGLADLLGASCPSPVWTYSYPEVEPVLNALKELGNLAEAAGAKAFHPLVPPVVESGLVPGANCHPDWGAHFQEQILLLNNRLRHEVPRERIIDFYSPMVRPEDYCFTNGTPTCEPHCACLDPVHMNVVGQQKRARAALAKLKD